MQKKDFKIESNIYNDDIIKSSISDFQGFDIKYLKGFLEISGNSEESINEIFNEFMNYILGIQNELV